MMNHIHMKNECFKICLVPALDHFILLFIIFPLNVLHWRGTWHLQSYYIFPTNYLKSSWTSFIYGSILYPVLTLLHPPLFRFFNQRGRAAYLVLSRFYLYLCGWAILGFWRGLWNLTDYYLTERWLNSIIIYGIVELCCIFCRTVRTNAGVPLAINVDCDIDLNRPDTRFTSKSVVDGVARWFYPLDVLFTQFVIVAFNILVWRGIWNVIDAFFLPHDNLLSDVASLILGQSVITLLFVISPLLARASERLDTCFFGKLIFEDVVFIGTTWAVLCSWRGGWNLVRGYVIPDKRVGGWICHTVGVTSLVLMQCFSTVALNGIDVDGSYERGEGLFPTHYLRYFFPECTNKEVRYQNLPDMSAVLHADHKLPSDLDSSFDLEVPDRHGATMQLRM